MTRTAPHEAPAQIHLVEVGPRDGLQNECRQLGVAQRRELIDRLARAGLRDIEVGSFVRASRIPQMSNTDDVARGLPRREGVRYWGLVPNQRGLERAIEAGIDDVAVVVSASETHNQRNLNRTREETLAEIAGIARRALGERLGLRVYVSTAFGCPYEGDVAPQTVLDLTDRLMDLGPSEISLGDTIGVGHPRRIRELCQRSLERYGADRIALHLHDTQGLAVANALAALELGVRRFDASIGGLGGCPYAPGASGNVGTEDLVNLFRHHGIDVGVDLESLIATSRWLEQDLELEIQSPYYRYAMLARVG
jgi:hydroxymethylglutaryl-CoA lyase